MIRPARLIFWFCAALVLNLTGFMTLAAVLPQLITNWSLTGTEAGWLGGIYFAGYVCAVPVLTTLTDRIDARRICLASALCAGAASIAFALLADGFWSALALRFLAGAGLGGTYMPGLKALTDRLPKSVEGRAVTYYSAVFALGTALSFLSGGEIAAAFGWRWAFAAAGVGCVIGFGIIVCVSGAVPIAVSAARAGLIGAFTIVFRNRQAMGYIMAFFGYAWEVFAFRVWVVAFVFTAQARVTGEAFVLTPTTLATLFALAGVAANMGFGELALARGRRKVLMVVACLSIVAACTVGLLNDIAYGPLIAICCVFAMLTSGRNAPTTAGSVAAAKDGQRGATMAVHATIGYAGGIIGPLVAGVALDLGGGINSVTGWTAAFAAMAVGGLVSLLALVLIARAPTP
jgi:MFS family permease